MPPPGSKKNKKGGPKKGKSTHPKSNGADNVEHSKTDRIPSSNASGIEEWNEKEEMTDLLVHPLKEKIRKHAYIRDSGHVEDADEEEEYANTVENGSYEAFEGEDVDNENYAGTDKTHEEHVDDDEDFNEASIEEPPPTPTVKDHLSGVEKPTDLEAALKLALAGIDDVPMVEFLQSLSKQTDVHAQAVMSAKEIANDFIAKAADLAEAMQMILQYDQLMLKKINLTTAYDFGVKPKTDEETRAVMIDRAQKILNFGQMQYEVSHQISDVARPLVDYRFEACDDVNAVKEKLTTIKAVEAAKKEELMAKKAHEAEEHHEERNDEQPEGQGTENDEGHTQTERENRENEPQENNSNADLIKLRMSN